MSTVCSVVFLNPGEPLQTLYHRLQLQPFLNLARTQTCHHLPQSFYPELSHHIGEYSDNPVINPYAIDHLAGMNSIRIGILRPAARIGGIDDLF